MTKNKPKSKSKRRSCLFVPAINMRAMEKTLQLDVDVVIFDLEDSIGLADKTTAMDNLQQFLKDHQQLPYFATIRINPVISNDIDELQRVAALNIDALVLPKVENIDELDFIYAICKTSAKRPMPVWAMIETPKGILSAASIASHPSVTCLIVGPNDIALASGVMSVVDESAVNYGAKRQYLVPWLMQIVLAAKAYNRRVLDGVYNDYKDLIGFEDECRQAKAMGFDGKTLIHPSQIEAANVIFQPTLSQVEWAQDIIAAFALPENIGKGVISLNGKMVEDLHLKQAQRILANSDNNE
ncbi:CoA ester lyase [Bartonella sp. HY329]|uniref:HpcH/HpaI aldolase/citrate lyase family protein n=1 Tax=unclassified Bartonella TaxID=2645622 RepID=UPI0021CA8285|nr:MULTISPECIES: CoA ester lyase [unclassified Bartonella]UXM95772.1 CoA ester lyase [Bartonella sp. HY329]UXN10097.1 CoA ester lyase [Bartonella sp. HY328]